VGDPGRFRGGVAVTPDESVVDAAIAAATAWGRQNDELILVRHGRPLAVERRRPGPDRYDPPLDARGRRQARRTARLLAEQQVAAVYSSDLVRAVQTAELVARRVGRPAEARAALREIGITGAPADGGRRFIHTGQWLTLTAGDTGFRHRVRDCLEELVATHRGTIVVVAHSGVINAHLADVLDLDRDYTVRPWHASITRTYRGNGRWYLGSLNETAHLPTRLRTA